VLNPYNNSLVMPLAEFIEHPIAHELLHNGGALQVPVHLPVSGLLLGRNISQLIAGCGHDEPERAEPAQAARAT
jgi:hypothetical protein